MVQADSYGSIPQTVKDLVANKVHLLDEYILCQTGDHEYTALIYDTAQKKTTQIRIYRPYSNSVYRVDISDGVWDWTINNEYYCYSNVGVGSALDLPVYQGVTAYAAVILSAALMFAIVFKGVLFPCLERMSKRR